MDGFVGPDGNEGFCVAEALKWRELDVVAGWRIERLSPAIGDFSACRIKEGVRHGNTGDRIDHRRRGGVILVRQTLNLIDVENRIGLQKWDAALNLITMGIGFGFGELAGIDHRGAAFPLADVTAKLGRLPERHPGRRGKAPCQSFGPQQDDVDTLIRRPVVPQRARDPAGGIRRAPGPHPGAHPLLQIGDNAIGDPGVDVDAGLFCPVQFSKPPWEAATIAALHGGRKRRTMRPAHPVGTVCNRRVSRTGPERQWRTAAPLRGLRVWSRTASRDGPRWVPISFPYSPGWWLPLGHGDRLAPMGNQLVAFGDAGEGGAEAPPDRLPQSCHLEFGGLAVDGLAGIVDLALEGLPALADGMFVSCYRTFGRHPQRMGLKAHVGREFALALGVAVKADRATAVLVASVIGEFGRGILGFGNRPGVELSGAMGGADIGADDALQVDLHGPIAQAVSQRIGSLDDETFVQVADAVAVEDREPKAFGNEGGLIGIRAGEPDHFKGGAFAELHDTGGLAGGAGGLGHVSVFLRLPDGSDRPLPVFPSGAVKGNR